MINKFERNNGYNKIEYIVISSRDNTAWDLFEHVVYMVDKQRMLAYQLDLHGFNNHVTDDMVFNQYMAGGNKQLTQSDLQSIGLSL